MTTFQTTDKVLAIWRGFFIIGDAKNTSQTQSSLEFICIDELVPADHLLRKVEKAIDFSFIHDLVKDLYCPDNARPVLDP